MRDRTVKNNLNFQGVYSNFAVCSVLVCAGDVSRVSFLDLFGPVAIQLCNHFSGELCAGAISRVSFLDLFGQIVMATNSVM